LDTEIFDSVRTGRLDFPSPEWDEDFVKYTSQKDAKKRPTVAEAMKHRSITKNARWPDQPMKDANISSHHRSLLANASARGTTFQKYLAMQKLKKAALVTIAKDLTQEEVGSLEDVFRQVDQTEDSLMSLTELNDAITRGKLPPEIQEEINAMKTDLSLSDHDTPNISRQAATAPVLRTTVQQRVLVVLELFETCRQKWKTYYGRNWPMPGFGGENFSWLGPSTKRPSNPFTKLETLPSSWMLICNIGRGIVNCQGPTSHRRKSESNGPAISQNP
jgi:serine/threonine protein kinase